MTGHDDAITQRVMEHQAVIDTITRDHRTTISQIGSVLARSLASGGCIFWFGNGGSAADSQHLAAELVGRFVKDRQALRSIALTTDTSILTSVGNDYHFDRIFSRQIEALGRKGDVAIGLSTSGNSPNVANGLKAAQTIGMKTVGLLGKDGGMIAAHVDHAVVISSPVTARIQEAHIFIGHVLCELVESELDLA